MIIFKILLIVLLAAPFMAVMGFLFLQVRNLSLKLNRRDKAREVEAERRTSRSRYRGY